MLVVVVEVAVDSVVVVEVEEEGEEAIAVAGEFTLATNASDDNIFFFRYDDSFHR